MRDEAGKDAPRMKALLRRLQRGAHLGRVVRVVVDQRHAADLAAELEAPADALEPPDRLDCNGNRHAHADGGGERRQRIRRIVLAGQLGGDHGEDFSLVPGGEAHPVTVDLDVAPVPVGPAAQAIGLHVGSRPLPQAAAEPRSRAVRPRRKPGLRPATRRIQAIRLAVVVFPAEPATTMRKRSAVSSPQYSASLTRRIWCLRAASVSGLPSRTWLPWTTRSGLPQRITLPAA